MLRFPGWFMAFAELVVLLLLRWFWVFGIFMVVLLLILVAIQ